MVVRFSLVIGGAATLLSACGAEVPVVDTGNASALAAVAPLGVDAAQDTLCASIAGASSGGDASLQGALAADPVGAEYGGGVIKPIIDKGGYRFVRADMVDGHCWANARAAATVFDRAVDLQWRCPVLVVSDDRRRVGKTVLEEVDNSLCEFDTAPGSPTKRAVEQPIQRIAV
ncbi:hypothetical protein [Sphingomonas sp.]|uniref:hypothetical protein n=1 Tax=Sphingomonas sp. TaxID=28214 RepID=UPI0035C849CF